MAMLLVGLGKCLSNHVAVKTDRNVDVSPAKVFGSCNAL